MRNYIASSMLSSLLTSPTNVLTKFESDKNNLHIVNSNLPSTKDSNNELELLYVKYVDENPPLEEHIPLRPLHGIPQDLPDPIDKILLLYSNM